MLCLIFAILPPCRNDYFCCGKGSVPVECFRNLTLFFLFFFFSFISCTVPCGSVPHDGRQPFRRHASGTNQQPFLPEPGNHHCSLRGWEAGCCPQRGRALPTLPAGGMRAADMPREGFTDPAFSLFQFAKRSSAACNHFTFI